LKHSLIQPFISANDSDMSLTNADHSQSRQNYTRPWSSQMRSLLFVPADSEKKLLKSLTSGADVLIFDLEDAVSLSRKDAAREILAGFLTSEAVAQSQTNQSGHKPILYVRVNAIDTGMMLTDLTAVMPMRPAGVVLPKCRHAEDLTQLTHYLQAFEAVYPTQSGEINQTSVIPIVTETAGSLAGLDSYASAAFNSRLKGLMWGAEDLSGDIGALANKFEGSNQWSAPFAFARTRCLLAAAAAGVAAIDTVPTDIHNIEALRDETKQAFRDGFSAKAAIHPVQVPAINEAMTPDAQAQAWAAKVVAAFEASQAVGVATLDGKMLDTPHLRLARKILAAIKT
jgi:citrate lyase subunit beta / citryl-CoA lyase